MISLWRGYPLFLYGNDMAFVARDHLPCGLSYIISDTRKKSLLVLVGLIHTARRMLGCQTGMPEYACCDSDRRLYSRHRTNSREIVLRWTYITLPRISDNALTSLHRPASTGRRRLSVGKSKCSTMYKSRKIQCPVPSASQHQTTSIG